MTLRAVAGGSSGGGVTIGTTTITSGTDKRVLFDDNGVVGEDGGITYDKTTDTLTLAGPLILNAGQLKNFAATFVTGGVAALDSAGAANGQFHSSLSSWGSAITDASGVGAFLNGASGGNFTLGSGIVLKWYNGPSGSASNLNGGGDIGLARNGVGILEVNNATAGTLADLTLRTHIGTGGLSSAVVKKTGTYTATANDYTIIVDATSGAVTINLPAATASGRIYNIKKIDSSVNAVTADGNASETIDGATTKVLSAQWSTMQIQDTESGKWSVL